MNSLPQLRILISLLSALGLPANAYGTSLTNTSIPNSPESECIQLITPGTYGTFDTMCVFVDNETVSATQAITRDTNGNGLLDRIELYFDKALSKPNALMATVRSPAIRGVSNTFDIQSITPSGRTTPETIYYVNLKEDRSLDEAQTGWIPAIRLAALENINPVVVEVIDGAGPVIVSASEIIRNLNPRAKKNTVTILFSEPIKTATARQLLWTDAPRDLFSVYALKDSAYIPLLSFLDSIPYFDKISLANTAPSVTFIARTCDFSNSQFINLKTSVLNGSTASFITDATTQHNKPAANNRLIPVIVYYDSCTMISAPNPCIPYPSIQSSDNILHVYSKSEATRKISRGGTLFQLTLSPQQTATAVTKVVGMSASLCIYDAIGNLVYKRFNHNAENDPTIQDLINNGTSWLPGQRRDLFFYWNGFNDVGMAVSPGIYRALVSITLKASDPVTNRIANQNFLPSVALVGVSR